MLIMAILFRRISETEAINLMQNIDLNEKKQNIMKQKKSLSHIKMDKEILTFADIAIKKKLLP